MRQKPLDSMSNSILRNLLNVGREDLQPPPDIPEAGEKKIVVVGSESCGKTCLIAAFVAESPVDLTRPVPRHIRKTIRFGWESVPVVLREGRPQPEFDLQRRQNYMGASVALVCFEFNDESVTSVRHWMDEVGRYCPQAVLLVVGCKLDENGKESVSLDVWLEFQGWIRSEKYWECSAKTGEGLMRLTGMVGKVLLDADDGS